MAIFPSYSGVILAGGKGKRFNGANKACVEVCGQRMIDRILAVFRPLFDEVILVTTNPAAYLEWDMLIVSDHFDQRSSLTGIHAGLFAARNAHVLVTACDMPFVQPAVVQLLLAAVEPRWDVIIPSTAGGLEPLLAIYSKRCLKPIEQQLRNEQYRIQSFFGQVRMKVIEERALRQSDPDMASFFNINSPGDLAKAEDWLRWHEPASTGGREISRRNRHEVPKTRFLT